MSGLLFIEVVAFLGAGTMYVTGVKGIEVVVNLEYVQNYYYHGGYYVYGWDVVGARARKY